MTKFETVDQLRAYFSDALGPDAVRQFPDSPRPYIKVAEKKTPKGNTQLLANVVIQGACHHPQKEEGKPQEHVPCHGVCVRFAAFGEDMGAFTPPLNGRFDAWGGEGPQFMQRMTKHPFPICPAVPGVDLMKSWKDQGVTDKVVQWIKGVCSFTDATPVKDEVIRQIVELPLAYVEENPAVPYGKVAYGAMDLFSLDVVTEDELEPKGD